MSDASANVVWKWDQTEPFGDSVPNGDPNNTGSVFDFPLRLSLYYSDKETGKLYANQRDCYDQATGRFCQSDPIGLSGGLNTYVYADGAPVDASDPLGLFKAPPPVVIGGSSAILTTAALAGSAAAGAAIGYFGIYKPFGQPIVNAICKNDDDCLRLILEIYDSIGMLRAQFANLLNDPCDLFVLAYDTINPSLPGKCGQTTFVGHITQIEGWQNRLRRQIQTALTKGCAIPPEAWFWASRGIPKMPRGWYPGYGAK